MMYDTDQIIQQNWHEEETKRLQAQSIERAVETQRPDRNVAGFVSTYKPPQIREE